MTFFKTLNNYKNFLNSINIPDEIQKIILKFAIKKFDTQPLTRQAKDILKDCVFAYEWVCFDDCCGFEVQMWELVVFHFKVETLYITTYSWDNWDVAQLNYDKYRKNYSRVLNLDKLSEYEERFKRLIPRASFFPNFEREIN
jgi:hypothetical protein